MQLQNQWKVKNGTVEELEALFNYATIGIVVTDQDGKIINFNKCRRSGVWIY
jgi:hypothetical protein